MVVMLIICLMVLSLYFSVLLTGYGCLANGASDETRRQSDRWRLTGKHIAISNGFASADEKKSSPSVDSLQLRLQELEKRQTVLKSNLKSVERRRLDDTTLSGQMTSKQAIVQR